MGTQFFHGSHDQCYNWPPLMLERVGSPLFKRKGLSWPYPSSLQHGGISLVAISNRGSNAGTCGINDQKSPMKISKTHIDDDIDRANKALEVLFPTIWGH